MFLLSSLYLMLLIMHWLSMYLHLRTIRSIGVVEQALVIVNPAVIFSLKTETVRNTAMIRNVSWKETAENQKLTITAKSKEKKMQNGCDIPLYLLLFP